jgi:hypothetical protein
MHHSWQSHELLAQKKKLQQLWMRKEMISNYSIGETTAEENLLGNQRIF